MTAIPEGWDRQTIADLIDGRGVFSDGDWVETKDQAPGGDVRLIQLADIGDGRFVDKSQRYLTGKTAVRLNCTFLQQGDVLVARMPHPLGRACIFPGDAKRCVTAVDVCIIRAADGQFSHRWLMWFVNSPQFRSRVMELQKGTTRKRISRKNLATIPLNVPPKPVQISIADKIDELFSDLDAGVAALERARANLKRYRASVLKAAVEGKLTEQWRAEHPDVEPASALLERILAERRKKWEEEQLRKHEAKGKKPPNGWRDKYSQPVALHEEELPNLPPTWCWVSLDSLADVASGVTKGASTRPVEGRSPVPYLRVANVQRGFLDLSEVKTVCLEPTRIEQYRLETNDILFTEGGDRDKLGRGWIWEGQVPGCVHQNHIFRARPFLSTAIESRIISYHGNSFGKAWFTKTGKQTVNLASINQTVLRRFPVPLPPKEEATEIVRLTELIRDAIDRLDRTIDTEVLRSSRLRQVILRAAFTGELAREESAEKESQVEPFDHSEAPEIDPQTVLSMD